MVFKAFFGKIKQGLAKTRQKFGDVAALFRLRGRVDQKFLDDLEKRLLLADVGTAATADIVGRVRQSFLDKEITGDVETFVKQQLRDLLSAPSQGITYAKSGPTVVMVAGASVASGVASRSGTSFHRVAWARVTSM